jgi:peptide/nickel transport system permease protein
MMYLAGRVMTKPARRSRAALEAWSWLLVIVVLAALVPVISPFEPNTQDLAGRLQPPGWADADGARHWMGTDSLGRDVMTRVFVGARYSLFISVSSVLAMFAVGTTLGLIAGFRGGHLDGMIMRLVDLQMAFPVVLAAIALVALFGPSFWNIVLVFMVTGWPMFARTTRGSTLALREREFVDAARALGAGRMRLMFREVLPNAMGPLMVLATYQVAEVILFEASLGFLGLGIQPPTPSWGGMMSEGRDYLDTSWWVTFFPGIALLFTAAAANRVGHRYNRGLKPVR